MAEEQGLDTTDTITRLQSSTVRNAVLGLVVSLATVVTALTGKVLNVQAIQNIITQGWTLLPLALTAWTSWRSYTGRVNATKTIQK